MILGLGTDLARVDFWQGCRRPNNLCPRRYHGAGCIWGLVHAVAHRLAAAAAKEACKSIQKRVMAPTAHGANGSSRYRGRQRQLGTSVSVLPKRMRCAKSGWLMLA